MSQSRPLFPTNEDMNDTSQSSIVITYNNEDKYREKVKNDYGIYHMYGNSWRDTIRFLSDMKMINLNKRWIDGKTYSELLHLGDIFPKYVVDIESAQEFVNNANIYEEGFKNHLKRVTRELVIISLTIIDMKSDLRKINYKATPKQQKILNKIKAIFVDPILIITNYTMLPIEDLFGFTLVKID